MTNYSYNRRGKAFQLLKKGRLLGLSKMLLKSLIFAVAGALTYLVFNLAYSRKMNRLKALKKEEDDRAEQLMQEEWDRQELERQPLL